ncbi:MAG: adenylosuccinate synthetase [Nitrospiraceae bacterium]
MSKPILIVQGGQYGSEGKGQVAAALCQRRNIDYAVRTGAVNAGHTVIHKNYTFKMQQLPTGFVNPGTRLIIGAGAYINPEILAEECRLVSGILGENIRDRLVIDYRAALHTDLHQDASQRSGRHWGIGATGKGTAEAIVDKMMNRNKGYKLFIDTLGANEDGYLSADTSALLNNAYDQGKSILIEGTQGTHLDFHLGPYPFVTSRMTSAANWIAECGLSPNLDYEIVLVCRTYPIRVAGNSGPLPHETSWPTLARRINLRLSQLDKPLLVNPAAIDQFEWVGDAIAAKDRFTLPSGQARRWDFHRWTPLERHTYREALSEMHQEIWHELSGDNRKELSKLFEMTTVTKKLRRIAGFDHDTVRESIRRERPNYIVLTFLNYVFPEIWGAGAIENREISHYVGEMEDELGCPIRAVTTGPRAEHYVEVD